MSYIVEQKIKGNIYLYNVESYWDKEKKQPRQKRTYLGPKSKKRKGKKLGNPNIINKKYGNIFVLNHLSEVLGLGPLLQSLFPDSHKEILSLAYYFICEGKASYLYPHWLYEQ